MSEQNIHPPETEVIKNSQPTPEEYSQIFFRTFELAQGDPHIDPKISRYLAAHNPDWRMSQTDKIKTFINFIWSAAKKTDSQHILERTLTQIGRKNTTPANIIKEIFSPVDRNSHIKITPKERYQSAIYNLNTLQRSLNNPDKAKPPTAADIASDILGREHTILVVGGGRSKMRNTPESRDNHLSYFVRYVLCAHPNPSPHLQPLIDEMKAYMIALIQDPEQARQMRTNSDTQDNMAEIIKLSPRAEPLDLSYLRKITKLHLDSYPKDKESLDPTIRDWLTKPAPKLEQ